MVAELGEPVLQITVGGIPKPLSFIGVDRDKGRACDDVENTVASELNQQNSSRTTGSSTKHFNINDIKTVQGLMS